MFHFPLFFIVLFLTVSTDAWGSDNCDDTSQQPPMEEEMIIKLSQSLIEGDKDEILAHFGENSDLSSLKNVIFYSLSETNETNIVLTENRFIEVFDFFPSQKDKARFLNNALNTIRLLSKDDNKYVIDFITKAIRLLTNDLDATESFSHLIAYEKEKAISITNIGKVFAHKNITADHVADILTGPGFMDKEFVFLSENKKQRFFNIIEDIGLRGGKVRVEKIAQKKPFLQRYYIDLLNNALVKGTSENIKATSLFSMYYRVSIWETGIVNNFFTPERYLEILVTRSSIEKQVKFIRQCMNEPFPPDKMASPEYNPDNLKTKNEINGFIAEALALLAEREGSGYDLLSLYFGSEKIAIKKAVDLLANDQLEADVVAQILTGRGFFDVDEKFLSIESASRYQGILTGISERYPKKHERIEKEIEYIFNDDDTDAPGDDVDEPDSGDGMDQPD